MAHRPTHLERSSTVEGLPVSPSLGPALEAASVPGHVGLVDLRVTTISAICILLGVAAAVIAEVLMRLIGLITQISFYGHFSTEPVSAVGNHLGLWVIGVPVIGGIIVGIMARYGSEAIRGHGIPEAIERVLSHGSRIPPRVTFLKPLSAAIAIGTGGPFGAEGPIIATGGALGSVVGQLLRTTAIERKTLLAAGAAAGMAATFGAPVSALLLAVELLLFEFRPRSLIPVAIASTAAAGVRFAFAARYPIFEMPALHSPTLAAMGAYLVVGLVVGVASVFVTRAVYAVEEGFERLPIHWMWWPAIGAIAVGVIGYFAPLTLGVGYQNITNAISAKLTMGAMAGLCVLKFISWAIALGSGTSGGTLAPLFTIGSTLGALLGAAAAAICPHHGIDLRVAALVGMAAMFAGASRALLTSVVFAFETTLQPFGLLPLLGGCTVACLVSALLMRHTIMTEKIEKRKVRVPAEFDADFLGLIRVGDAASTDLVTLREDQKLGEVRQWMETGGAPASHQGFPVIGADGFLVGVVTRRNLLDSHHNPETRVVELIRRPPVVCYDDSTLRDAADHMVNHDVGRLPVMSRSNPGKLVGIITRSDVLSAHRRRLQENSRAVRSIRMKGFRLQEVEEV